MNSDLAKQQEAFKKSLQQQPVIQRKLASSVTVTTTHTSSNSSIESLSEELRIDDNNIRHVNSYVHAIISFLRPLNRQVSFEEIKQHLNIDIDSMPELLEKISRNDRVSIRGRFLAYNYIYNVNNSEDLMQLLKNNHGQSGILVQDLKESCPSIETHVQEGLLSREILCIRGKDDSPRVLFHNPLSSVAPIELKFRSLWNAQVPPNAGDLESALARAGLKGFEVTDAKSKGPVPGVAKAKTARKFNKRTRITNTHIEGLDFSTDFQPK